MKASLGMETGALECDGNLWIAGECFPDKSGTQIFGHHDGDALINSEAVSVVPVRLRVEGIAETIAAPGLIAVVLFESAKHLQACVRNEGK